MHQRPSWRAIRSACLSAFAALFLCATVAAQGYPSKTITIVVAYPPGGDTDAVARLYAEKLSARLKQNVVVENRGGATGIIGSSSVAKAPADGYTLLFSPSTISIAQMLLKVNPGTSYDVVEDFSPIALTGTQPVFLVANAGAGIHDLKELIAQARAKDLSFASPGAGSPLHILGEVFKKTADIKLTHVPYRGVAPAVTDVMGGHVPMMFITWGPVAPLVASGKLTALAVAEPQRSPFAPQVPTMAELGYKDVTIGSTWQAVLGPKGMSPEVVKILNDNLNAILKMPDVIEKMHSRGVVPAGGAPSVLGNTIAQDQVRFTKLIKDLNIKIE